MVIFLWLQSWLLALSRAVNLNFWRFIQTLLKRTHWKDREQEIQNHQQHRVNVLTGILRHFGRCDWTVSGSFPFLVCRSLDSVAWQSFWCLFCGTVALISGRNVQGWLRKQTAVRTGANEGWHSGKSAPCGSNLCPVKGQSAQQATRKKDLLGLNLVWNSVLWKVLHGFKPGWRFFFACKN